MLGPSQQDALADLTAFGLVVARGRIDALIDPSVRADLRSIVLQRVAMEIAVTDAGMDESALRRAYDRNPLHELVVRHLVVLSERWRPQAHRDSARSRAEEALRRARSGEDFEELVAQYSDEPGAAARGGRLQPGREGSWVPEFWNAASSLDEGEISGVVETEFGFHVIRLEERRPVPFEEARDDFLESFVDLPRALGRAADWVSTLQSVMRPDTGAILAWRDGEETGRPLIVWPDSLGISPVTGGDLSGYVETFRPEAAPDVPSMDTAAVVELALGTTRTHIMLDRAAEEGIEPTEAQRVAVRQRWEERVAAWAEPLGFREGQSPSEVKAQALRALGAQAQSAAVARSELARLSNRLRQMVPVTVAATTPGAPTR